MSKEMRKEFPSAVSDIISDKTTLRKIKRWMNPNKRKKYAKVFAKVKAIVIEGAIGTGKTTLAHLIAAEFKLKMNEINATHRRSARDLQKKLIRIGGRSVFSQMKETKGDLVLFDDADTIGASDPGGAAFITAFIKKPNPRVPVIITLKSIAVSKGLKNLKYCSILVSLKAPSPASLRKWLSAIGVQDEKVVSRVTRSSVTDFREARRVLEAALEEKDYISQNTDHAHTGKKNCCGDIVRAPTFLEAWEISKKSPRTTSLSFVHNAGQSDPTLPLSYSASKMFIAARFDTIMFSKGSGVDKYNITNYTIPLGSVVGRVMYVRDDTKKLRDDKDSMPYAYGKIRRGQNTML